MTEIISHEEAFGANAKREYALVPSFVLEQTASFIVGSVGVGFLASYLVDKYGNALFWYCCFAVFVAWALYRIAAMARSKIVLSVFYFEHRGVFRTKRVRFEEIKILTEVPAKHLISWSSRKPRDLKIALEDDTIVIPAIHAYQNVDDMYDALMAFSKEPVLRLINV